MKNNLLNNKIYRELPVCETADSPTLTLDSLRKRGLAKIPSSKKVSYESTRARMKTQSKKIFSFRKLDDEYFIVKRIK